MSVFRTFSEIEQDIGRKSHFFIPPLHSTPPLGIGGFRQSIAVPFVMENLEWCGYRTVKKFDDMFSRFDRIPTTRIKGKGPSRPTTRIPACDRQTDKIVCAMHGIGR